MRLPTRLVWLLALPLALAGMRRADKRALIQLFTLLGGPYWTENDGWDADGSTDPCDMNSRWFGVGCIDPCDIYRDGPDCFFGRATALTLRDNNLTGSITNWTGVGDLHNLSWIDLSVNEISGSLPAEFGNIQNIEMISMSFNKLVGHIPSSMGALNSNGNVHINELNFERNSLQGELPSELGLLTKLRMLHVGHNSISGSLPPELTNLTELQVLYVNGNRHGDIGGFTGEIPEQIGKMVDLRFLNASENNISGTLPPSAGDLQDLMDMTLMHNEISGTVPLAVGKLYGMRHLRLNDNNLDGNFSHWTNMGDLRNLITFDLYNNHMVGDIPPSVQNLTSLQYLYVDNLHLLPLRVKYCRQRIPNNGKYNYLIVREDYVEMMAVPCEDMHDVNFAFNSLQDSGVYPD